MHLSHRNKKKSKKKKKNTPIKLSCLIFLILNIFTTGFKSIDCKTDKFRYEGLERNQMCSLEP